MAEITAVASHAHGTQLEYSVDGGTVYTKINGLVSITPPAVSKDEIETTDHDSGGWKEFIAGLKDGGSMPFKINVKESNEASITALNGFSDNDKVVKWKITVPTQPKNLTIVVDGFVKSFNADELISGSAVTMSGEIRCSGKATFGFKAGV